MDEQHGFLDARHREVLEALQRARRRVTELATERKRIEIKLASLHAQTEAAEALLRTLASEEESVAARAQQYEAAANRFRRGESRG